MFAADSKRNSNMKRTATKFLQAFIVLISIVALVVLIRMPLSEGRVVNLDLFSIYSDPLILYVYASSVLFFVALYNVFRLLGHIGRNKIFSPESVSTVKRIKYCAIILSVLIVLAGVYIRIFHAEEDDPAGFIALCMMTTLLSVVVAVTAAVGENILQKAIDMKSENDLTI